jgi:hypothetical protein
MVDYREPNLNALLQAAGSADAASAAEEDEGLEQYDYERDRRIVENEATKKATHWVVNNRGLWARLTGRFRLPQDVAKRAARQCVPQAAPPLQQDSCHMAALPGRARSLVPRSACCSAGLVNA